MQTFADIAKKTSEDGGKLFGGGLPQFGTSPFNATAAQAQKFKVFYKIYEKYIPLVFLFTPAIIEWESSIQQSDR